MRRTVAALLVVLLGFAALGLTQDKQPRPDGEKPKVREETVKGGLYHSKDDWTLITGRVTVKNGYTVVFADGTEAEVADGLALNRRGVIGGKEYPAGREAAEFLRKLIGDREVTLVVDGTADEYRKGEVFGRCYLGETDLGSELIRNGWAFARHSSMVPVEIMARENKRGMWRGELAPTVVRLVPAAPAQEPKAGKNKPSDDPAAILGAWASTDRHLAMASVFQPEHGVRKRDAVVHFARAGDRLTGHALAEFPRDTAGRTDFRTVTFADGRLTFEYDVTFSKVHGPLAVEAGTMANTGTVRVDARLEKGRLVGVWTMALADGTEFGRGEWEAVRAAAPPPRQGRSH